MATVCTLAARGLRLPARPRRTGAVIVRAASTRLPPPTSSHSHPEKPKDVLEMGDVASIVATLGLTGSTIGTYMDGIHTRAQVLIYDKLPLVHGGLHTSAVVPPLLAGEHRGKQGHGTLSKGQSAPCTARSCLCGCGLRLWQNWVRAGAAPSISGLDSTPSCRGLVLATQRLFQCIAALLASLNLPRHSRPSQNRP